MLITRAPPFWQNNVAKEKTTGSSRALDGRQKALLTASCIGCASGRRQDERGRWRADIASSRVNSRSDVSYRFGDETAWCSQGFLMRRLSPEQQEELLTIDAIVRFTSQVYNEPPYPNNINQVYKVIWCYNCQSNKKKGNKFSQLPNKVIGEIMRPPSRTPSISLYLYIFFVLFSLLLYYYQSATN